ncbi:hypothetical protein HMPREF2580_04055 [Staphylococcus sp. HMSC036D05]|uniref:hypothetical protein n=1 Tax=Staphylococcus sp. HMSC036D05 TaxID=1715059 RepID=UPI0008AA1318|nr:hypothetical protein [Staphylococcus sp. HMSC036D05]OHO72666.1 hypothetical protein HMPREF2580_04055 [Staphylococcus sp. HMSC036D05]
MNKLKLTKYQIILMILFFIIYTITVQISSRSILEKQIQDMPNNMNMKADVTLFWLNIVTIVFALILIIFQSLIYKIIVGVLGSKEKFSIGLNLFLFLGAVLPSSIIIALLTLFNHGMSVSQNIWVNTLSILLSTFIYSVLLWYFSVIEKRKILIVFLVIAILNIIISIFKFLGT